MSLNVGRGREKRRPFQFSSWCNCASQICPISPDLPGPRGTFLLAFYFRSSVELLSPRSRQLPLICNTSACGRWSPAPFNQSVSASGWTVSQSRPLVEISVSTPPTCFVGVGIERKIIRQKTGQECYGYSIKCCRGEKNKAQHMWVMLLQENNLVFVLQEYKLVQVTT